MYTNCDEVFKLTIPAVRIATAKSLARKYAMSQSEIAKRLGIAQPAVSKYLSGKYTKNVRKLESMIERNKLEAQVSRMIMSGVDRRAIAHKIDEIASSEYLVREAMKLV